MTTLKKAALMGSAAALALSFALPVLATDGMRKPESFKAVLNINPQGRVIMNSAEVTAVGASSLTIKLFGTSWTVNVSADTKFVRKFGGISGLAQIAVGDRVNVRGSVVDGQLAVNATHVRNASTRETSFRGTIASVTSPDMLTVTDKDGVIRTVKVTSATKIMVGDETKTFADLAVGMKVGVKGFVNANSTVVMALVVRAQAL